jgi:Phytanoyl-CoA dioxygenase (PhyH)
MPSIIAIKFLLCSFYQLPNVNYTNEVQNDGFAVIQDLVDANTIDSLLQNLPDTITSEGVSQRAGRAGIRNLLQSLPSTRTLANGALFRSIVEPILGNSARVVRGIYFDKHKDANWKVAWHQDLTIAVRERVDLDGYGPWSIKAGIHHVQPPVPILENMLSLRLHLDDTDESNGALRVLPGTHKYGRLAAQEIQNWRERQRAVMCPVRRGGVMLMRPLLLHSSAVAKNPEHRRVLHFEYSSIDLMDGLSWFEDFEQ